MPGRSGQAGLVRRVRRHGVPAWWRDAKLGIFVHWTPASVPAFAPVGVDMGALLAQRRPDALAWSPYAEWYQNSLSFPDSPVAEHHRRGLRRPALQRVRPRLGGRPGQVGPRRLGAALRGHRGPLRRAGHQAPRRLLPVADRGAQPARVRVVLGARRGGRAGRRGAGPGDALRRVLLGRAGLDLQRPSPGHLQRPGAGPARRRLSRLRRGPGPRADRSLPPVGAVERHLLAGLDRQAGRGCWPTTTRRCPTAWSTTASCPGRRPGWWPAPRPARRLLDVAAARSAKADKGIVPAQAAAVRRAHARVHDASTRSRPRRGSACVASTPASATTSSPTRRTSCRERDLLWSLVDIVAKGGNLLLNVGPRGVDATIAEAQVQRLDWLAEFTQAPARPCSPPARGWYRVTGRMPGPSRPRCATGPGHRRVRLPALVRHPIAVGGAGRGGRPARPPRSPTIGGHAVRCGPVSDDGLVAHPGRALDAEVPDRSRARPTSRRPGHHARLDRNRCSDARIVVGFCTRFRRSPAARGVGSGRARRCSDRGSGRPIGPGPRPRRSTSASRRST